MLFCFSKLSTIFSVSPWQYNSFQISDHSYFPLLAPPHLTQIFTGVPQTQHNPAAKASPMISGAEGWLHLSRELHSSYQNPIQCLPFCNPMTQLIHVQHVIYYNPRLFSEESCQLNNCPLSQTGLVALFLLGCSVLHLHHWALPFLTYFCHLSQKFWIHGRIMASNIDSALSSPAGSRKGWDSTGPCRIPPATVFYIGGD